jgi:hypothetical protein
MISYSNLYQILYGQTVQCIYTMGSGWLNELGSWITYQLIQVYHQYGVGSRPTL